MSPIIFNRDIPFGKQCKPGIYCNSEQYKRYQIIEKANEPFGQTVCYKPIIKQEIEKNFNRLNCKFFELELDKSFDRELAVYFNLTSYKVGPTGRITLFL